MCEVCAIFGAGEHWSDFGRLRDEKFPFDDIQHYRDERKRPEGFGDWVERTGLDALRRRFTSSGAAS